MKSKEEYLDQMKMEEKLMDLFISSPPIEVQMGSKRAILNHVAETAIKLFEIQNPEIKETKGKKNGNCNRTACQSPENVTWFNSGTREYYCYVCAQLINERNFNDLGYDLCVDENNENSPVDHVLESIMRGE